MRSKDTKPELTIRRLVHSRGLRYRKHVASLPGTPDLVFPGFKVAVFVDGDFFHGWRFPLWRDSLTPYWREKIERNRQRDASNFRKLRNAGWVVLRVWQHQVKADPEACVDRIEEAISISAG